MHQAEVCVSFPRVPAGRGVAQGSLWAPLQIHLFYIFVGPLPMNTQSSISPQCAGPDLQINCSAYLREDSDRML